MANTKFEMILKILFLKISNVDVLFKKEILTWKSYITYKALPTTKQFQIVDLEEFVIATLDINNKTFVMHVDIWEREKMLVHSKKQAQVGALLFNKVLTKVLAKYFDYSNIFLIENVAKLLENIRINEYAIKLEKDKQLLFNLIYNLGLVELETLKTYIKTNLAASFIWPSKSPARILIFFDRKPNKSLRLYINYWSLNNITIKN